MKRINTKTYFARLETGSPSAAKSNEMHRLSAPTFDGFQVYLDHCRYENEGKNIIAAAL